jgi:hypothetical protein
MPGERTYLRFSVTTAASHMMPAVDAAEQQQSTALSKCRVCVRRINLRHSRSSIEHLPHTAATHTAASRSADHGRTSLHTAIDILQRAFQLE